MWVDNHRDRALMGIADQGEGGPVDRVGGLLHRRQGCLPERRRFV